MRVWFVTKYESVVCYFLHGKIEEEEYERGNISVNVTLIYQWVFYDGISVCIWYFHSSATSPCLGALLTKVQCSKEYRLKYISIITDLSSRLERKLIEKIRALKLEELS